jgi:hypothetical protein
LRGLLFDTEDGGTTFLRNFGELSTDFKASHPRKFLTAAIATKRFYLFLFKIALDSTQQNGAGIAKSVGWLAWVRFPAMARDFSLFHNFHTGSGTQPASYPISTGVLFPSVKRPETIGGAMHVLPSISSWCNA